MSAARNLQRLFIGGIEFLGFTSKENVGSKLQSFSIVSGFQRL
jgi:hypothetical protein